MNKIYIGFHGTLRDKKDSIKEKGFEKSISTIIKKHWLGDGVYFFEDEYYAAEWNILDIERNKKKGIYLRTFDYIILKGYIKCNTNKLMDMSSPEGITLYKYFKEKLKEKYIREGKREQIDKLDKRSAKFWMTTLSDNGFFDEFDVIIASYVRSKQKIERSEDDFIENHQRQICVRETKCINNVKEYTDIDRIKELYKIIVKNRNLEMIGEYNE